MTRRDALGLGGSSFAAMLLGGCGRKSASLRYRITVEVDTPDGVRSGSSEITNHWVQGSRGFLREIDKGSRQFFGEAPFVDLGRGRYLFALLNAPRYSQHVIEIVNKVLRYPELVPPLPPGVEGVEAYRSVASTMSRTPLRRKDFPVLVTFGDIAASETVQFVDPDALDVSFGEGYRLRQILFAVTDEAPTPCLEKLLGWLGQNPDESLDPAGLGTTNAAPRYWLRQGGLIMRPMGT